MNLTERKLTVLCGKDKENADKLHERIKNIYEKHYNTKAKVKIYYNPKSNSKIRHQLFLKPFKKESHIPDVHFQHNAELGAYETGAMTGKAPEHTSGLLARMNKDDKWKTTPTKFFRKLLKSHDVQYNENNSAKINK